MAKYFGRFFQNRRRNDPAAQPSPATAPVGAPTEQPAAPRATATADTAAAAAPAARPMSATRQRNIQLNIKNRAMAGQIQKDVARAKAEGRYTPKLGEQIRAAALGEANLLDADMLNQQLGGAPQSVTDREGQRNTIANAAQTARAGAYKTMAEGDQAIAAGQAMTTQAGAAATEAGAKARRSDTLLPAEVAASQAATAGANIANRVKSEMAPIEIANAATEARTRAALGPMAVQQAQANIQATQANVAQAKEDREVYSRQLKDLTAELNAARRLIQRYQSQGMGAEGMDAATPADQATAGAAPAAAGSSQPIASTASQPAPRPAAAAPAPAPQGPKRWTMEDLQAGASRLGLKHDGKSGYINARGQRYQAKIIDGRPAFEPI